MEDAAANTAILCFGPVRASVAGQETQIIDKGAKVVATLATDQGGVSTDQLLDEIWESDNAKALRQLVFRLRQKLGADAIETAGDRYRLRGPVDLWEFGAAVDSDDVDTLATALHRWEGTPFESLDTPRLMLERERLRRIRSSLATSLGTRIASERRDELVQTVIDTAVDELENEALVGAAMAALANHGRQREALDLAQRCRTRLRSEFGLEPGAVLLDAEQQVLTGQLDQGEPVEPLPSSHSTLEPDGDSPYVGRAGIVTQLHMEVAQSARGAGRIILVEGVPGSGKSTLADLFAREIAPGRRVRRGASAGGDLIAYEPWVQAVPELTDHLALLTSTEDPATNRLLFSRAVVSQLAQLADPEVVVVLDDMHGADTASAALMRFCAQAPLPSGVTIVTLARPVRERMTPWSSVTLDLLRNPSVAFAELGPLSPGDVRSLVGFHHGERFAPRDLDRLADEVFERSVGNAFVASILARDLTPDATDQDSERREIATALAGLAAHLDSIADDELVGALAPAAVIGLHFGLGSLCELTGRPEASILEVLRRAVHQGIVQEGSEPDVFRFEHDLTREHFETKLLASEHRRFAARLVADATTRDADRLRHLKMAGDLIDAEHATSLLLDAAARLQDAHAFHGAVEALTTALDRLGVHDPRRTDVLIDTAACCSRLAQTERGLRFRDEAFALAAASGDHVAMCRAALAGLPDAESHIGDPDRVAKMARVDLDQIGELRSQAEHLWAQQARLVGDFAQARTVLASAGSGRPTTNDGDVRIELERLMLAGSAATPRPVSGELAAIATSLPSGSLRAEVHRRQAVAELVEQLPQAVETIERARREATTDGTPRTQWSIELAAQGAANAGIAVVDPHSTQAIRQIGLRTGQRDADEAAEGQAFGQLWRDDSVGLAHDHLGPYKASTMVHGAMAFSAASAGKTRRARRLTDELGDRLRASPEGMWNPVAAAALLEVARRVEVSPAVVDIGLAILRPWSGLALIPGNGFTHIGPADRYLAIGQALSGDFETADALLLAASDQALASGATAWLERIDADNEWIEARRTMKMS
ncbi:MAG: AAA family ATPase [Actinomycetota bacterium]